MGEMEAARNTKTILAAVVVIAIIGVGGYIGISLLGGGGTTTGTTTTTTTGGIKLTILSRHDVAIEAVYEPAFLASDFAKSHGITGLIWKTPTQEFWEALINTGQIDVCWGGGPTLFDQLMRDNLLLPLNDTTMQTIQARINNTIAGAVMKRLDTKHNLVWIAAAISSFGFTLNNKFLSDYSLPAPTNWTDLAKPIYGKYLPTIPTIAMGDAPGTTSNTRIYEIIYQGMGWDAGWSTLARMVGSSSIYGGSVETQAAAELGQVGVAMSIDYYGYLSQYHNHDCQYVVPAGQTIVNGDPIAIANNTSHKELAEGFVDFVLSAYGQSLWLDPNIRRMPVMKEAFKQPLGLLAPDLYATFNETIKTTGIAFNDTLSLLTNTAFIFYWQSVFTNAQSELRSCWKLIVDAYYAGHLNQSQMNYYANLMGNTVTILDYKTSLSEKFTIAYATAINSDMINDATYLSQQQARWTIAAKNQYNSIYSTVLALLP
jgi:ABC-type Fe3+ transport system substrate-binding protein